MSRDLVQIAHEAGIVRPRCLVDGSKPRCLTGVGADLCVGPRGGHVGPPLREGWYPAVDRSRERKQIVRSRARSQRWRVFGHPGKRTQVRSVGQYRGWRLCLRSEAPKLFLPISALLLTGRTVDYLSRAQIISRRVTINMLEFQSSKNEGKAMKKPARNHVNRKPSESDGAPAKPTGAVSGEFVTEMFEYDGGRQVTV